MSLEVSGDTTASPQSQQIEETSPVKQEAQADLGDRLLPAVFISAAGLILAWLDPIYIQFESHPVETLIATGIGVALVWLGTLLRRDIIMYIGVALLFVATIIATATQPTQLSVPIVAIWPL